MVMDQSAPGHGDADVDFDWFIAWIDHGAPLWRCRDQAMSMTRKGIIAGLTSFCTRFRRDRRGVTALEFGLVGPLFIVLLCGILENGLILLTQTVLDNATRNAARMILIGSTTSSQFSTALCNNVSSLIPCASIKFNVQSGSTFAALNPALQIDAS